MRLKVKTLVWAGAIAGAVALGYALCRMLRVGPLRLDVVSLLCAMAGGVLIVYKVYRSKVETSRQRIDRLTRLHLATIEALTLAIDAKDPLARGHIQRVRRLAEGLARAAGYPEDQMEGLKAAALLHDIGKLAVPEHILNKPGKLSAAEYSKIMIHPVVGADILSNVEFPYEVVPIVKHHHERFDGGGYPSGLRGDEIPLAGRIVAIADVFDALTSRRRYKAALSVDQAVDIMLRERGTHFDAELLDLFVDHLDEIEVIRLRWAEPDPEPAAVASRP
jgi:putative nucleotidyltransferase with HDIG domain